MQIPSPSSARLSGAAPMRLRPDRGRPFDRLIPIQNWYYPLDTCPVPWREDTDFLDALDRALLPAPGTRRALYVHVPFCDTICSFCPFVRSSRRENGLLDAYVEALLREIDLRAASPAESGAPVGAIFVGGGTPSLLRPAQIRALGQALHGSFETSALEEFSFEMEAKSVTAERLEALRDAGVTHVRLGVQSFDPRYRELFALTATLEDVRRALTLMQQAFRFVSFDLLHGMRGQTLEDALRDVDEAAAIGTELVDLYPINDVVTQPRLHRAFREAGFGPTPAGLRVAMREAARERMRSHGFAPHNGHGYVRAPTEAAADPVVSEAYSFRYHEYVYGYADREVLGFGTNAISTTRAVTLQNEPGKRRYIEALEAGRRPRAQVGVAGPRAAATRPIALGLPYHGVVDTRRVNLMEVDPETLGRLGALLERGLVEADGEALRLRREGWSWYVNLMYYLSPSAERRALDGLVEDALRDGKRELPLVELLLPRGDGHG